MAVLATPLISKVRLQLQTGLDGENNPIYRNKTYSRIKTDATDQDVFDTAAAIAALSSDTLSNLTRVDEIDLADQV